MLNLPIVMFQYLLAFSLILFAQTAEPSILTPQSGQTLRGQVQITGNLDVIDFSSAELSFAYSASDAAQAWFAMQTFSQPVKDPVIAVWDTTLLTDGDYTLRLRVNFLDGTSREILVPDLKIRNDVPLPSETPTATASLTLTPNVLTPTSTPTLIPSLTPEVSATPFPSPIPLPTNPAALSVPALYITFGRGALIAFILFVVFSLLLRLRRN